MKLYRINPDGRCMMPTLRPGDILLARARQAQEGDVAAIRNPQTGQVSIKRLVAFRDGQAWFEGDNASDSADSRNTFGWLPQDVILGVIVARVWPYPKIFLGNSRVKRIDLIHARQKISRPNSTLNFRN